MFVWFFPVRLRGQGSLWLIVGLWPCTGGRHLMGRRTTWKRFSSTVSRIRGLTPLGVESWRGEGSDPRYCSLKRLLLAAAALLLGCLAALRLLLGCSCCSWAARGLVLAAPGWLPAAFRAAPGLVLTASHCSWATRGLLLAAPGLFLAAFRATSGLLLRGSPWLCVAVRGSVRRGVAVHGGA